MKRPPPTLQGTVFESFAILDDRRSGNAFHPLETVLLCLVVGVLCGGNGFVQAREVAVLKISFLRKYVDLSRGVPSHDTMTDVLAMLDPQQFAHAFAVFVQRLAGYRSDDVYNLDGKTLSGVVGMAAQKRSRSDAAKRQLQIVTLFSTLRNIVLGQLKTARSVNEVKSAQELLELLDIRRGVVTADAQHAVRRTFEIILAKDADFIVTVKGNVASLHREMLRAFDEDVPIVVVTHEKKRWCGRNSAIRNPCGNGDEFSPRDVVRAGDARERVACGPAEEHTVDAVRHDTASDRG